MSPVLRDLGDGLRLRQATEADVDKLVDFNGDVHRHPGATSPSAGVAALIHDLLDGHHPTAGVEDFTLVEDATTGEIVSSMTLISQTWSYGGVQLRVGRPELVGTSSQYRRRGLVRAQFEQIHEWSAQRGEVVQAITGIPWFYRQFGYEMALELGGGRVGYAGHVPLLREGDKDPFVVRAATSADVPFMASLHAAASDRYLVSCVRDEAMGAMSSMDGAPPAKIEWICASSSMRAESQ